MVTVNCFNGTNNSLFQEDALPWNDATLPDMRMSVSSQDLLWRTGGHQSRCKLKLENYLWDWVYARGFLSLPREAWAETAQRPQEKGDTDVEQSWVAPLSRLQQRTPRQRHVSEAAQPRLADSPAEPGLDRLNCTDTWEINVYSVWHLTVNKSSKSLRQIMGYVSPSHTRRVSHTTELLPAD